MYMWVWEYPPKLMSRESELCPNNIRQLNNEWREILELENKNEDRLEGPIGGEVSPLSSLAA